MEVILISLLNYTPFKYVSNFVSLSPFFSFPGHIINSVVEKRLNGLFSIIGCVLFVISGALIIDQWHDKSELLFKESKRNALAAGSLMIINGAVFLMDTISIFRT